MQSYASAAVVPTAATPSSRFPAWISFDYPFESVQRSPEAARRFSPLLLASFPRTALYRVEDSLMQSHEVVFEVDHKLIDEL